MKVIKDDAGVSHGIVTWAPGVIYARCQHPPGPKLTTFSQATDGTIDCMMCLGTELLVSEGHHILKWASVFTRHCMFAENFDYTEDEAENGTLEDITCPRCRKVMGAD